MNTVWERIKGNEKEPFEDSGNWLVQVMAALESLDDLHRKKDEDMARVLEEVERLKDVIDGNKAELVMLLRELSDAQSTHHKNSAKVSVYYVSPSVTAHRRNDNF